MALGEGRNNAAGSASGIVYVLEPDFAGINLLGQRAINPGVAVRFW